MDGGRECVFEGAPPRVAYPPYFVPSTREKVSTKEEDEEGNARFAAIEPLRPFRPLPPPSVQAGADTR